jgi:hypothetical protein
MDLSKLKEPFMPEFISWRIGQSGNGSKGPWARILAYVDNRAIMDRLDEICGPDRWWNEFKPGPNGGVVCGITILMDDGRAVTKWDGADNTDIEPTKGGISDAMKRAAVQWGIGRYLYDLGESWAEIVDGRGDGASHTVDKKNGLDFWWKPPRLPEWALPEASKRPAGRPQQQPVSNSQPKQEPPKPAEPPKQPPPATAFDRAFAAIRNAKTDDELIRLKGFIAQRVSEGVLTQAQADTLNTLADGFIVSMRAASQEPVAA